MQLSSDVGLITCMLRAGIANQRQEFTQDLPHCSCLCLCNICDFFYFLKFNLLTTIINKLTTIISFIYVTKLEKEKMCLLVVEVHPRSHTINWIVNKTTLTSAENINAWWFILAVCTTDGCNRGGKGIKSGATSYKMPTNTHLWFIHIALANLLFIMTYFVQSLQTVSQEV